MSTRKQKRSPRYSKTDAHVCALSTDNASTDEYWIIISSDTVSLTKQRNGEKSAGLLWDIAKKDFNKLIDWYNRKQTIIKRRKRLKS